MTGRLPFDASKARASAGRSSPGEPVGTGSGPRDEPVLAVSQATARIGDAIDRGLPATIRVRGEVSNFRERTHWYFDLKDDRSLLGCVCFASSARRIRVEPKDGTEVVATGRVEFYAPSGRVSLIVSRLEAEGAGASEQAFQALLAEVTRLGWTDPERKRPVPRIARRVAVITSRSGAALHDVINTMARRSPGTEICLVDRRMQGPGAAAEIAQAVRAVNRIGLSEGIDTILLTRGGGSAEDLGAFNDRDLAAEIVLSELPVVAAIGHETDTTIAELVADLRAATPTQAAVLVTPDTQALVEELDRRARRLVLAGGRRLGSSVAALDRAAASRALRRPEQMIANRRDALARGGTRLSRAAVSRLHGDAARLDRLAARLAAAHPAAQEASRQAQRAERFGAARSRLAAAMHARLTAAARSLDAADRELAAIGPMTVLERGYSITTDERTGAVVRSRADAAPGQRLRTRLADGEISSIVPGPGQARKQGRPAAEDHGMDLFAPAE
ncbi:MAG: exodeoxyribonuclease VII large subunit [Planctomycetota bacterium]